MMAARSNADKLRILYEAFDFGGAGFGGALGFGG